jgi:hypothetical protein
MPSLRRCCCGQSEKGNGPIPADRPVALFKRRMVLIPAGPPVPEPWTTPIPPMAMPMTITPAVRLCGRARRRSDGSGQGGYADGGSDGGSDGSHSADTPKQSDRHSCDGTSQQLARCLWFSASARGCQHAISHSAHPSFHSSHLHFQAGGMRYLRVFRRDGRGSDGLHSLTFFPRHSGLGKDPRDPYLGSSGSPGAKAPDGTNTAYAWQPVLPRTRWARWETVSSMDGCNLNPHPLASSQPPFPPGPSWRRPAPTS